MEIDLVEVLKKSSSDLKCPRCNRVFTRPGNLYWHIKDEKCRNKEQNKLVNNDAVSDY